MTFRNKTYKCIQQNKCPIEYLSDFVNRNYTTSIDMKYIEQTKHNSWN